MKSNSPKLLIDYLRSLEAVRFGLMPRDKLAIVVNRVLHLSFPLNVLWYEAFGRSLIDPRILVRGYRCQYRNATFHCPGGNQDIQFLKQYEPNVKQIVSTIVDGDAVDVGSNMGLYTVMLSRCSTRDRRILSIEADPEYFRWLRKNIESNHCLNVTALNIAAWSTTTILKLARHRFGGPPMDSSVASGGYDISGVRSRPLDDIFRELEIKPRFIKIDVEGPELEVMNGAQKTIRSEKPTLIFESLSDTIFGECSSMLSQLGYTITPLRGANFLATFK